jgi:hypothetical protein
MAFANALRRTPWQGYAIAAAGTFLGLVLEGFIIDTDHWRHFWLMLGAMWGMFAATQHWQAQEAAAMRVTSPPGT